MRVLFGLQPTPLEFQDADTEAGKLLEGGLGKIEIAKIAELLGTHINDGCDDLHVGSLLSQQDLLAAQLLASAHLVLIDGNNEI